MSLLKPDVISEVESISIARSSVYELIAKANDPDTSDSLVVQIHKYLIDNLGKVPVKQEQAAVFNIQLDGELV